MICHEYRARNSSEILLFLYYFPHIAPIRRLTDFFSTWQIFCIKAVYTIACMYAFTLPGLNTLFRRSNPMVPQRSPLIFRRVAALLPVIWLVLQSYHLLVYHVFAGWVLRVFPYVIEAPRAPHVAVASICNLVLFGTLAAIWPNLGFGNGWKPNRYQSLTVFFLIAGAFLVGQWFTFLPSVTASDPPFNTEGLEYTYSTINSQTKYELLSVYESDLI